MSDYLIEIVEDAGVVAVLAPTPPGEAVVYASPPEIVEIVAAGPQGTPGAGVILLEVGQTTPPVGTPVGSIIFRKLS